jgi:hypothetical protein
MVTVGIVGAPDTKDADARAAATIFISPLVVQGYG